ncbi:MAG: ATP-dependent zinc metalloprotease FtsH [bacterium]
MNKKESRNQHSPNRKNQKKDENFQWKKATRTLTFWLIIIFLSIFLSQTWNFNERGEVEISYSQFMEHLKNNQIIDAIVENKEFHGKLASEASHDFNGKREIYTKFKTTLPEAPTEETAQLWLEEYHLTLKFKEISNDWWSYLLNLLPWVLFGVFWIFLLRRMQGGGAKGIFTFGKSKAKLLTENQARVTFEHVAGADEAKQELREIIEFLKEPEKFQKLGGKIPKGALLLGPPGTGKTLLAKAVAGEAGVPFFSMSGADFVEMFVGVGASRVRDLFEQGKKNAPCIIFIDEVDAVGRHRGAGLGGGHDEREQTLNQLLVEMDGFDSNEGVILIAATNRPDVLDHALLRPGRFDRRIVVDWPDLRGREGILRVHSKNIPLSKDVNLPNLAKGTPGFSGADLANLVNEAALAAARQNKDFVEMRDLEEAKDKVMMGAERRSMLISDYEKKVTAYHEAGHVLVAKYSPSSDPVYKVTIIPRGRALGLMTSLPEDEKHSYSKAYWESRIAIALGGRAAEKLVMNELTTGAGNDLEKASDIARKMVCEWGMSEKLGPLTFGKKEEEIFLGREIAKHRDYSENTAQIIDAEVTRIVTTAERQAEGILNKHIDKLHALSKALLEREVLDGDEINQVLNGQTLKPMKSKNEPKKAKSRKKKRSGQRLELDAQPLEKKM